MAQLPGSRAIPRNARRHAPAAEKILGNVSRDAWPCMHLCTSTTYNHQIDNHQIQPLVQYSAQVRLTVNAFGHLGVSGRGAEWNGRAACVVDCVLVVACLVGRLCLCLSQTRRDRMHRDGIYTITTPSCCGHVSPRLSRTNSRTVTMSAVVCLSSVGVCVAVAQPDAAFGGALQTGC